MAEAVRLLAFPAVQGDLHLANKGLVDIGLGHSEEMRQLPLKVDIFRVHLP